MPLNAGEAVTWGSPAWGGEALRAARIATLPRQRVLKHPTTKGILRHRAPSGPVTSHSPVPSIGIRLNPAWVLARLTPVGRARTSVLIIPLSPSSPAPATPLLAALIRTGRACPTRPRGQRSRDGSVAGCRCRRPRHHRARASRQRRGGRRPGQGQASRDHLEPCRRQIGKRDDLEEFGEVGVGRDMIVHGDVPETDKADADGTGPLPRRPDRRSCPIRRCHGVPPPPWRARDSVGQPDRRRATGSCR
jgi:hypothetical protein